MRTQEITHIPEPKPPLTTTLANLSKAYAQSEQGEYVDPNLVVVNLTNLFSGLTPKQRRDVSVRTILKNCGPLAKDLITDPEMLRAIYPERYKKKSGLRKKAMKTALALGAFGISTMAVAIAKEVAKLQAQGGPTPIEFNTDNIFANSEPQPTLTPYKPKQELAQPTRKPSTTPTSTPTKTPAPTETPTATKTPESVDTFDEFLRPLIQAAQNRRLERAKYDPEYLARVDPELNSNRPLNIVIFGYGETFEPPAGKAIIGSPTIISYNAKLKTFDQISLTHDIRAPEIERYLQKKGQQTAPTRIDQAYQVGGFELMRQTLESATGLSVDFSLSFQDSLVKDMVDSILHGLPADIPFDLDTQPFYQDNQQYQAGHFAKGKKILTGIEVMQFMKALPQNYDRKLERNERKHIIMKALLETINLNKSNPGFLINALTFLTKESIFTKRVATDFDLRILLNIATHIAGKISRPNSFRPHFDRSIYIVDPSAGDGGVAWVHSTQNTNPFSKHDLETGEYQDPNLAIPGDGNPHADNLTTGYWKSLRDFVKQKLS